MNENREKTSYSRLSLSDGVIDDFDANEDDENDEEGEKET